MKDKLARAFRDSCPASACAVFGQVMLAYSGINPAWYSLLMCLVVPILLMAICYAVREME